MPYLSACSPAVDFGWGEQALRRAAEGSERGRAPALVVVDVLRFTTCVSVAVSGGSEVLPYRWRDSSAADFAERRGALLAGRREDPDSPWSLSPVDLAALPPGSRLVLPSPNGAALSVAATECGLGPVVAGALRNAAAVGRFLADRFGEGRSVLVVAAGERWPAGDGTSHAGSLRPAVEDLLGAGAVLDRTLRSAGLGLGAASPDARAAIAAFRAAERHLPGELRGCPSGQELCQRGWSDDVDAAAALDVDTAVPVLLDGAYGRG